MLTLWGWKEILNKQLSKRAPPGQMLGKTEGRRRRGREDEMLGWHHRLDGHEFEQVLGVDDRQGSLACCSLWGRKE